MSLQMNNNRLNFLLSYLKIKGKSIENVFHVASYVFKQGDTMYYVLSEKERNNIILPENCKVEEYHNSYIVTLNIIKNDKSVCNDVVKSSEPVVNNDVTYLIRYKGMFGEFIYDSDIVKLEDNKDKLSYLYRDARHTDDVIADKNLTAIAVYLSSKGEIDIDISKSLHSKNLSSDMGNFVTRIASYIFKYKDRIYFTIDGYDSSDEEYFTLPEGSEVFSSCFNYVPSDNFYIISVPLEPNKRGKGFFDIRLKKNTVEYTGRLGKFEYIARDFQLKDRYTNTILYSDGHSSNGANGIKIPHGILICDYMFENTHLVVRPIIPETTISCKGMFYDCPDLEIAPVIPYGVEDCRRMFSGCTRLKKPPVIPSSVKRCDKMFAWCDGLEEVPIIPKSVETCEDMFEETGLAQEGNWNIQNRGKAYYKN